MTRFSLDFCNSKDSNITYLESKTTIEIEPTNKKDQVKPHVYSCKHRTRSDLEYPNTPVLTKDRNQRNKLDILKTVYKLNERLAKAWLLYITTSDKNEITLKAKMRVARDELGFTDFQKKILIKNISDYNDLSYLSESLHNSLEIREILCLHLLNHLYDSKTIQLSADEKIRSYKKRKRIEHINSVIEPDSKTNKDTSCSDPSFQQEIYDRGYTQPRILLLFPTRILCLRFMKLLFRLIPKNAKVANKDRFLSEFADPVYHNGYESFCESDFLNGSHPLIQLDKERFEGAKPRSIHFLNTFETNISNIPSENRESFQNDFETFRFGFSLRDKKNFTLYTDFFKSDVIVATPLALIVGANIDEENSLKVDFCTEMKQGSKQNLENEDDAQEIPPEANTKTSVSTEKENFDYLSSIEICFIVRGDLFLMQNFAHLTGILNRLCQKPSHMRPETNFARIRPYFFGSRQLRTRCMQLILTSSFVNAHINSIIAAKTSIIKSVTIRKKNLKSTLRRKIIKGVKLSFCEVENKLEYFEQQILKNLLRVESKRKGLLIVANSYFDFIVLRNKLESVALALGTQYETRTKSELKGKIPSSTRQESSKAGFFASLSEYSSTRKISKLRADFVKQKFNILLITERFHFYFRYHISNVKNILFYGLPLYANHFVEILEMAQERKQKQEVIFTKESIFELERIVGTKVVARIRNNKKKKFEINLS